jgi:hypothetical protein
MRGLLLLLCFLGGCATTVQKASLAPVPQLKAPAIVMSVPPQAVKVVPVEAAKPKARNSIRDDVIVFRNLQMLDLEGDGRKEIVAVYTAKAHTSGVKVIKFAGDQADIMYVHIFNSPNTKLAVRKGMPEIVSEEFDPFRGFPLKKTYVWDGKTFRQKQKPRVLAVIR